MSNKMQQLLDYIVNEEMDKANELFHEIVVEKSRDIYENLIAEESKEEDDEEVDESSEDEEQDESVEEGFGSDETEIGAEHDEDPADPADALVHDTEVDQDDDSFGGEEGGTEPATKDDVQDLEDALAELKAEFEALMGGSSDEAGEEDGEEAGEENPFGGSDDSEEDDSDDEADDSEEDDSEDESMGLREYRETVGNDWDKNSQKEQGKNLGAGTGEDYPAPSEGKSPVSSGKGKPTTGANAKNIVQAQTGEGTNVGTSTNADKGSRGLVGKTQGEFTKGVEKNIAGSASAKMKDGAALGKQGSGYPGNNKSAGPVGSGSGDKAGQTSVGTVKSPLNGAPNRNA
jgi:hypothetical protein